MKTRRKRYTSIGIGNKCPKCKNDMERRSHSEIPKKTWYYEKWDYCKPCGHIQHYEEFKSLEWKKSEHKENSLILLRNICTSQMH